VLGKPRRDSERTDKPPDVGGDLHKSLKGCWWLLEIIPKLAKWREWRVRRSLFGLYLPLGEPRPIADDALVHGSALDRRRKDSDYRPVNLPPHPVRVD
jgi:hypothetical protein